MRTWLSFRTPLRGVRLGASVSLNARPQPRYVFSDRRSSLVHRLDDHAGWPRDMADCKPRPGWPPERKLFAGDNNGFRRAIPLQAGGSGVMPADRNTAKMIEPTEHDIGRAVV
jgi:hypothetical protein